MQFPTLTSGSLAALILLAPNAVNAASKIGGDGKCTFLLRLNYNKDPSCDLVLKLAAERKH
ncbi:hypothetical protein PtrV1_02468 [Pyrenophora tritici-repentis]|nr:hypothetical protein PtrV1_02468 [Pyrenophora tritici-repentis]KAI0569146.1 hypothetical protein Alg215_11806 [Pyrenophora tritici-repentis]